MKLNRTLIRAIEILELLSKTKEGYTLAQLASILDSPKSSIFDILKTLVYKNMVVEDCSLGVIRYKIGLQAFLIGSSYLKDMDIVNVARNELINLANRMNATSFIAVLDDSMVTYLYKYESENTVITTANIGSRNSVHAAAIGKCILAFSSEGVVRQAIQKTNFTPFTEYTITSVEKYLDELKTIRTLGYAKNDREESLQQIAVAAPLRNHEGEVVAAISLVGGYESTLNLDFLGEIVKDVADSISEKLGYHSSF